MEDKRQKKIRRWGRILFFIYLLILIYFLFFSDRYGRTSGTGYYRYNLVPFNEIKRYILYSDKFTSEQLLVNIMGNIGAFLPFGFFVPITLEGYKSFLKVTFLSLAFSACVESIQLIMRVGSFDVDDIILNTTGGALGFFLYFLFVRPFCNKKADSGKKQKKRKEAKQSAGKLRK